MVKVFMANPKDLIFVYEMPMGSNEETSIRIVFYPGHEDACEFALSTIDAKDLAIYLRNIAINREMRIEELKLNQNV